MTDEDGETVTASEEEHSGTDTAGEQTDRDLTTEMAHLQAATDGTTVEGVVVEEPYEEGGSVVIEVQTPMDEFVDRYEKPTPPLEDSDLQAIADTYGLGLVDLSALEGERVQCRYNPDAEGDWEIIVPEDESISGRLRTAVAGFWAASKERDWTLTGAFYYLLCPPLFLLVTMLDGFLTGSTPSYDEWGGYVLSTVFVSVVWLFVVGLLLLTL